MLVLIGDYVTKKIEFYSMENVLSITDKSFHVQDGISVFKYLLNGNVASGSWDTRINVWNPKTWSSIQVYKGHTRAIWCLDQIDVDTIVSGSEDKTIHIWKISTGQTKMKIDTGLEVYSVKVLLNGFQIACGLYGSFRVEDLRIYNYRSGSLVKQLIGKFGFVPVEVLNEQLIASASLDKFVIIWDLVTYSIKHKLSGHRSGVIYVKLLANNLLASAGFDNLIIIWNWLNGSRVFTLTGHSDAFWFSPLDLFDDQTLISGSLDKTIKFWNITNGALIETINIDIQISALAVIKTSEFYLEILFFGV